MARFELLNSQNAFFDGHRKMDASETSVYRGYIASVDNDDGELITEDGSHKIIGLFYDFMSLVEYPTTENLAQLIGKNCNIVSGVFDCILSADLFSEGTLPAIGDAVYNKADGSGKWDHTSSNTVNLGTCIGTQVLRDETGATATGAVIRCIIPISG